MADPFKVDSITLYIIGVEKGIGEIIISPENVTWCHESNGEKFEWEYVNIKWDEDNSTEECLIFHFKPPKSEAEELEGSLVEAKLCTEDSDKLADIYCSIEEIQEKREEEAGAEFTVRARALKVKKLHCDVM